MRWEIVYKQFKLLSCIMYITSRCQFYEIDYWRHAYKDNKNVINVGSSEKTTKSSCTLHKLLFNDI